MSTVSQPLSAMCNGKITTISKEAATSNLSWNPHPTFKGVTLKHLICGADTDGKFSAHIVHIKAGCAIGEHTHPGQWEIHEVIGGNGCCLLNGSPISYKAGAVTVFPPDIKHQVEATENDLFILAKFIPALL